MGAGMKKALAWSLTVWTAVIGVVWVVAYTDHAELMLPLGPAELLFVAVGAFLIVKSKGKLIGPLLLVGGSAGLVYDLGTVYAAGVLDGLSPHLEHLAAWLGVWTGPLAFVSVPMLLVLFPDGSFRGGRRWWIPVFVVVIGAPLLGAALMWQVSTPDLVALSSGGQAAMRYGAYDLINIGFLSWFLIIPASITLAYRFWRSSKVQRQQIKWLLAAAVIVTPLAFVAGRMGVEPFLIMAIAPCAAPAAIAIAVFRYRLYELDRIISRTVSYTVVVGLLGGLFTAGAVWLPSALGLDNSFSVAASTLTVAALFNPMRKRIQGWVDLRFNRSTYDAARVIAGFAGTLSNRVDPDGVTNDWLSVVSETMQPVAVSVWVRK